MLRVPPFIILFFLFFTARAQQFADKKHYLVDSLELGKLENYDILLIDSMIDLYHKEKSDTAKLLQINYLVENLEDSRAWMPYNRFMLKESTSALSSGDLNKKETRFYKTILAGVYNNFGYGLNQEGNKEEALEYFKKSMVLLEELDNKQGLSDVYNNIGLIYKNAGQVSKCLEYYFKCLKICEAINDTKGKASSLNNIGMMYKELEDYNKGLEYMLNALKEWEKLDNKRGMSSTLGNLGLLYSKVGKPELSLEYYFKALILNERTGDKEGIGTELGNIGWVYFEQGKYEKALDYFERSLQYRRAVNDNAGIAFGLTNLGSVYKKMNNNDLALKYGTEALEIGKKIGYPEVIRRSSLLLYSLYKEKNKPSEALEMYEQYIAMRDSTLSDQTRKAGLKKQYQYEFELKEKELKSEQEKRDIQYNDEIQRQKIIFNASLIGGIVFLVFSIVLYQRFRLTRRQKGIIEGQKVEMDKAYEALHGKNKEVLDSIYYARRIQNTLLTSEEYFKKHFGKEHFIFYRPKDIVSGDFYWGTSVNSRQDTTGSQGPLHTADSQLFYLAVCDSTGHGVPGAFMSLLNIGFLSEAINEKHFHEPDRVFNYARKRLIENVNKEGQKDGFDGALFCFDTGANDTSRITYAAAYCKPIVVRNGEVMHLESDRMPVGLGEKIEDFRSFEFEGRKGDILYIFTDGFADQFGGPHGKKFKYKPLVQLLAEISARPLEEQQSLLAKTFDDWKGNLEQVDDVCIIGVRL
jgi:serine phosphatase RsbU (regulator of sigma subunit)/Tfp pilus assembly protein PilF